MHSNAQVIDSPRRRDTNILCLADHQSQPIFRLAYQAAKLPTTLTAVQIKLLGTHVLFEEVARTHEGHLPK